MPGGYRLTHHDPAAKPITRSFVAIGQWVAHQPTHALADLGVPGRGPGESRIRRAFGRPEADALDLVLGAYLWTRTTVTDGRRVIALDGKTVHGARTQNKVAPHLVAAYDHGAGTVLGQVAITAKSNEIPAVQGLLALFDLNGAVVTVDAMHTQSDTANLITAAGGDYVFTVKGNQPTLHAACKNLPWAKVPAHRVSTRRKESANFMCRIRKMSCTSIFAPFRIDAHWVEYGVKHAGGGRG